MPSPTYIPLASTTLGSSASSVTFSSISQAYRDLVLVYQAQATTSSYTITFKLNSDSGANYSRVYMLGNGSTTSSGSDTQSSFFAGYADTTMNNANTLQIMDYSATDKHKTALIRANPTSVYTLAAASRWANTAAVTTITGFLDGGGTFAAGSTFTLYGIGA